jgi:uncharacterized membrane protein
MEFDIVFWNFLTRFLHVGSGIMWIGLLYYFNFVQVPAAAGMPDELKPAIGKHIAPRALFWFRWAALSTVVFGLLLAGGEGYLLDAMMLGLTSNSATDATIGFGMWLGLIMAYNVWMIIWPAQKVILGLGSGTTSDADKKPLMRKALMASRTNVALSIPMLFAMLGIRHLAELGFFG